MRARKDCYVMMDVEASGHRLGHHDMTQFGAVAVWGKNLEYREAFPVWQPRPDLPRNLIAPQFNGAPDPDALKVAGIAWETICEFGEPPAKWVERFHNWIVGLKARPGVDKVILVGHGITFDWARVQLLYDQFRVDWPCHYSGMDFKSWWGGMRAKEHIDSSMTDMREFFGVKKNKKAHDAQADAEYQLDFMLKTFATAGIIEPPASAGSPSVPGKSKTSAKPRASAKKPAQKINGVQRMAAKRLASLGGSEKRLKPVPRRRSR
ncbi:MAG: 3'-5' exonuclease [Planctomycetes bacterium]|nr:3'-5' exonuclease [Planctomycetota bacterium]NUQ34128.1 hypothetical protein [Planctomycetaceae bacterium]